MSLLVYTTSGSLGLQRPTVLRRYAPNRTTRPVRYTKSLSTPMGLDFTYVPPVTALKLTESRVSKPLESTSWERNRRYSYSPLHIAKTSGTSNLWKRIETPSIISNISSRISTSPRWWRKEKTLCTPDELLDIIRDPVGYYELPTDPCNEVFPGIYLSDGATALCTSLLKRMGVTHVLNAAQGKERPNQVNTSPGFYSHSKIFFLGIEACDHIAFKLHPYFQEASDFIHEALKSNGKVLVHCRAGISRSATLVCAYLMIKHHLSAQEAVRTVRKHRAIIPNDGFLQQLCDLNDRLQKK